MTSHVRWALFTLLLCVWAEPAVLGKCARFRLSNLSDQVQKSKEFIQFKAEGRKLPYSCSFLQRTSNTFRELTTRNSTISRDMNYSFAKYGKEVEKG